MTTVVIRLGLSCLFRISCQFVAWSEVLVVLRNFVEVFVIEYFRCLL